MENQTQHNIAASFRRYRIFFAIAGMALLIVATYFATNGIVAGGASAGDHYTLFTTQFIIAMLCATVAYAIFWVSIRGLPSKLFITLALSAFIITSFLQVVSLPGISSDYYRYLWQGRVVNNNGAEYQLRPRDAGTEKYNYQLYARMDWKEVRSLYPLAAEKSFGISSFIFDMPSLKEAPFYVRVALSKLPQVLYFLGSIVLIGYLAGSRRLSILWALNPLVLFELLGSAHIDGLAVFLLLAACGLTIRKPSIITAAAVGGLVATATLVKLAPFVVLVPLAAYLYVKKGIWAAVTAAAGFVFVMICWLAGNTEKIIPLIQRISYWSSGQESEIGNPLFTAAKTVLPQNGPLLLKIAVLVLMLIIVIRIIKPTFEKTYSVSKLYRDAALLLVLLMVTSPVLLPWYWIAPLTLYWLSFMQQGQSARKKVALVLLSVILPMLFILQYVDQVVSINDKSKVVLVTVISVITFIVIATVYFLTHITAKKNKERITD